MSRQRQFPILETPTGFRKVVGNGNAGRVSGGRESARLMCARPGQHFLHWRHRLVARRQRLCGLRQRKFGLRGGAVDGARTGTKNIHVAHLIIDSGVDTAGARAPRAIFGKEALDNPDLLMLRPRSRRPTGSSTSSRAALEFELEIRPRGEV